MSEKRELPKGWIWRKIGEICRSDKRIIPPKSEEWKKLPYVGLANIASDTGKIVDVLPTNKPNCVSFHFSNRHILFSKLRPYLNKVALPNFEGICSTEAIPLMPKPSLANREYLAFFIRRSQVVEELMRDSIGSRQPRARMKKLFDIPVPLPPLAEQERIAGLLARQMTAVEKARKAAEEKLAAARLLPSAFLRDAFGDSEKRELPKGWVWAKIGEVCDLIFGQSPPSAHYKTIPEGLPFFQGKADFGDMHPTARIWCDKPLRRALPGDILISIRAPVGPTNVADVECCIGRGLAALRSKAEVLDKTFLLFYLKSAETEIAQKGSGSTFAAIGKDTLRAHPILLPPLAEQKRIAGLLARQMAASEKARKAAKSELREIRALPAALLRQAFAGAL